MGTEFNLDESPINYQNYTPRLRYSMKKMKNKKAQKKLGTIHTLRNQQGWVVGVDKMITL